MRSLAVRSPYAVNSPARMPAHWQLPAANTLIRTGCILVAKEPLLALAAPRESWCSMQARSRNREAVPCQ